MAHAARPDSATGHASPGDDIAQLEAARDLQIAIGRLSSRIRRIYARADERSDISFTELAILRRLDRQGPTTPSALAGAERVTAQWVAIVVNALTRRGYVSRSTHPSDRRKVLIALTDAGRQVLSSREQRIADLLSEALSSLESADRERLIAVIPVLEELTRKL